MIFQRNEKMLLLLYVLLLLVLLLLYCNTLRGYFTETLTHSSSQIQNVARVPRIIQVKTDYPKEYFLRFSEGL
jgi:predicted small secreted protein